MRELIKKWESFRELFFDYEGYERVLEGLRNTLLIAFIGLAIGIVIGTLIAIVRVIPKYKRLPRFLDGLATVYVSFFRGTPIVVQLLIGYYVLLPAMEVRLEPLVCCIAIFGLNSGAYVSEIMRGGINSIDPGQLEAARALGLGFPISMVKVVVPQAIKNILPTLGNELIVLLKDTSVVSFVSAVDLSFAFQELGAQRYEYLIPYLIMAVVYLVMVLGISALIRVMERRLGRSDRRK